MAHMSFIPHTPDQMKPLADLVATHEEWLMARVLEYAKRQGYTRYTSTLVKAWQISISGLSASLLSALQSCEESLEPGPGDVYTKEPVAAFGVLEAQRHRARGVTLGMFLGLMKYYRQGYVDLVLSENFSPDKTRCYRYFVDRFFDRMELGVCVEWNARTENEKILELQTKTRIMTNEKNKFLTLFESLDTPVVLLDPTGNVMNLNQAWEKVFGVCANYYDPLLVEPLSPGLSSELSRLIHGENCETDIERELETVDGPRHFQITVKKMVDVSEKFSGTVVILKDITKRIRAETQLKKHSDHLETLVAERASELVKTNAILRKEIEERKQVETVNVELYQQLLHSQKMEAVGTMAGGIAHDFNNILSAILGFSELAQEQLPAETNIRDHLKEIITACLRAKQLVMQILAFSHKDNQQQKPVRLDIIVREVLKLFRAMIPASIEIRQDIETDCGAVLMAPTHIHQIVMNLCANAYHAMKETGGALSVSLKAVEITKDGREPAFGLLPGPYLRLSVSDTGYGMDDTVRQKIFEPYFTTKKQGEGTGLGLSVIHGIIKKHHGHINVFSEPGKGSTFRIDLPCTTGEETLFETDLSDPVLRGSEHILIVDDEAVLAGMWQQHLELLGYRVTACTNSQAAVERFKRHPETFDLVLTDMNMPNITGSKLSRIVMDIRPDIPIILSTGYDEIITEKEAMALGIKAFILKPVLIKDLARTIRDVLEKKQVFRPREETPAGNFAEGREMKNVRPNPPLIVT